MRLQSLLIEAVQNRIETLSEACENNYHYYITKYSKTHGDLMEKQQKDIVSLSKILYWLILLNGGKQ